MSRYLKLITPPAEEPLDLVTVKSHRRVTLTLDDEYLLMLIPAARQEVERTSSKALITQVWELVLDGFPADAYSYIEVPIWPLQSVQSIKYRDWAGAEYTWNPALYQVDTASRPGRILPVNGQMWPWPSAGLQSMTSVTIRFTAGEADHAAGVPELDKLAMLLWIGHYSEHREADDPDQVRALDQAMRGLLGPLGGVA